MTDIDVQALQVPDGQYLAPVGPELTDADLQLMLDAQAAGDIDPHAYDAPSEKVEGGLSFDFHAEAAALISVPTPTGTAAQMAARAVAWATSKVGIKESPAYSNDIFVWDDMYPSYMGEPYCLAGAVDAWARQGVDLRKQIPSPYYCPSAESWAKKLGVWHTASSGYDPKPGDISLMGSGSIATHAALSAPTSGSYNGYRQVEFNTSSGNSGSQTNGDGIYIRYRTTPFIRGWIAMQEVVAILQSKGLLAKPATSSTPAKATATKPRPNISLSATMAYITGSRKGQKNGNVAAMQRALHRQSCSKNCPLTSVWDAGTKAAYRAYQLAIGYKGADADGIPGATSWNRLMKWAGYTPVK